MKHIDLMKRLLKVLENHVPGNLQYSSPIGNDLKELREIIDNEKKYSEIKTKWFFVFLGLFIFIGGLFGSSYLYYTLNSDWWAGPIIMISIVVSGCGLFFAFIKLLEMN